MNPNDQYEFSKLTENIFRQVQTTGIVIIVTRTHAIGNYATIIIGLSARRLHVYAIYYHEGLSRAIE